MLIKIEINTDTMTETEQRVLDALSGRVASSTVTVVPPAAKATAKATPEPVEDLLGAQGATLEDAVARATTLVSEGRAAEVKAALATAGAKRVSELKPANIQAFLDALDG